MFLLTFLLLDHLFFFSVHVFVLLSPCFRTLSLTGVQALRLVIGKQVATLLLAWCSQFFPLRSSSLLSLPFDLKTLFKKLRALHVCLFSHSSSVSLPQTYNTLTPFLALSSIPSIYVIQKGPCTLSSSNCSLLQYTKSPIRTSSSALLILMPFLSFGARVTPSSRILSARLFLCMH